ncbi:MAG: hypothetical protein ACK56I_19890, partial [bacterium]
MQQFSLLPASASRSSKLTSSSEFGVLQPKDEGPNDEGDVTDEPCFRQDAFAVKIMSILVKLLTLPAGPRCLTAGSAASFVGPSPLLCLVRLAVTATPRVRCLACQALQLVLPCICDDEVALTTVDTELESKLDQKCGPGSTLIRFLLRHLGKTLAAPLLSALTLSTTA